MSRLCLYFRTEPERDRWLPGDRFVRPIARRILRGRSHPGGVDKVFINLCLGLDKLKIPYQVNLPFSELKEDDYVGVLGRGRRCLDGYDRPNRIVAGIGLMTHPSEWPTLCDEYPVARYLQHSEWTNNIYKPYFGDRCAVWPVGIDSDRWKPPTTDHETTDFLIYDKVMWKHARHETSLLQPIRDELKKRELSFVEIRYGYYEEEQYQRLLQRCRGMIFLCEHESQGLAYQECLSTGVPILAWDQGWWLDPNRFRWGQTEAAATSVPYFDHRCGLKFRSIAEFPECLDKFLEKLDNGIFEPRGYILESLTLAKCAQQFLEIVKGCALG